MKKQRLCRLDVMLDGAVNLGISRRCLVALARTALADQHFLPGRAQILQPVPVISPALALADPHSRSLRRDSPEPAKHRRITLRE